LVTCDSIFENQVVVEKEKLSFRASVYAIMIVDGKILLIKNRSSGKYAFPGGGIEIGEPILDALVREVKEETGLNIKVESFFHFKEHFFYYDPLDQAFHSFMVFYLCHPQSFVLIENEKIDDIESESPEWFDLYSLSREIVQSPLREIYDLIKERIIDRET